MRKTVRSNRTRKDLPYELYNNLFSKTKEGIVGKPSTFFLAVFLPHAVIEPTPPETVQFETVST